MDASSTTAVVTDRAPKHFAALDGIRGLAVLLVFLFHYAVGSHSGNRALRTFGLANKAGWSGVVLFFVLSGFLITGILWDSFADEHWWRKFFARRTLRIFPLYYLTLLFVVVASIPAGAVRAVLGGIWVPALFLENLPHLQNISLTLASPLQIYHLWSLAVEEQFYLIWPFLLALQKSRKHAKVLCALTFILSLAFRLVVWCCCSKAIQTDYTPFLLTQAGALAAGGWMALSFRGPEWERVLRFAPAVTLGGLLGFSLSAFFSGGFESGGKYMMTVGLPSATLLYSGLVALALRPGLVARLFSAGWIRWLGNISYGIYIFHIVLSRLIDNLAQRVAHSHTSPLFYASRFLVAAILSIVAALLSFHLYEKQFLRLKKYFVPAVKAVPKG